MKKFLVILTICCIAASTTLFAYMVKGLLHEINPEYIIIPHTIALYAAITLAMCALIRRGIELRYIRQKNYAAMNCINFWSGIIVFPLLPSLFTFGVSIGFIQTMRESMVQQKLGEITSGMSEIVNFYFNSFAKEMPIFAWFTLIGTLFIVGFGIYMYGLILKTAITQKKYWEYC